MGVWVQLLQVFQVQSKGVTYTLHPGDWWEFSRTNARDLVDRGVAKATAPVELTADETTRVLLAAPNAEVMERLCAFAPHSAYQIATVDAVEQSPGDRIVWWDGGGKMDAGHMAMGLNAVLTWDVAIPLGDYTVLACDVGSDEDRAATAALGIDLRVPLYSPHLLFLRAGDVAQALIEAWLAETTPEGDARLALLRAIWQIKPLLLPLPATWMGARV